MRNRGTMKLKNDGRRSLNKIKHIELIKVFSLYVNNELYLTLQNRTNLIDISLMGQFILF